VVFPLELLAFYPEIRNDFENVYEIKDGEIVRITHLIEYQISMINKGILPEKPGLEFLRRGNKIELYIDCKSTRKNIQAYKKIIGNNSCSRQMLPNVEHIT